MATATVKFNGSNQVPLGDATQDLVKFYGSVTFSAAADTYATGGLLALAGFDLKALGPYGDRTPLLVLVQSLKGSGYTYVWNRTTNKLAIFSSAAGSGTTGPVEITNATALNAATPNIFTDDVVFELVVPRR